MNRSCGETDLQASDNGMQLHNYCLVSLALKTPFRRTVPFKCAIHYGR